MPSLHKAETQHNSDMQFTSVVNNKHKVIIDTTEAGGGHDAGPSPKPLLLTALSGCTAMDVVALLKKMRVNFTDFTVEAEADLRDEHPKIYTEIRLTYKIKIAEADYEKLEKAVELSKEQYCGVSAMLAMVCPIVSKIVYL
jgi:putative redox protein